MGVIKVKNRKIAAFILAFFLVVVGSNNYLLLTRAESDPENTVQTQTESTKAESTKGYIWESAGKHVENAKDDNREAIEGHWGSAFQRINESDTDISGVRYGADIGNKEFGEVFLDKEREAQDGEDQTVEEDEAPGSKDLLAKTMLGGFVAPNDIGSYLEFTDYKLEHNHSIVEQDNYIFERGYYTFSIKWKTIDPSTTFDAGDYFTFKVPSEFGSINFPMVASDGSFWGEIVIDKDGNGTAVFNQAVSTLQNLKGTISISGSYWETTENIPLEWKFIFDGEYTYTGTSGGAEILDNIVFHHKDYKSGGSNGDGTYRWNVHLNEKGENWTGRITIVDTLGPGHKMAAYGGWIYKDYGYYGKTNYDTADNLSKGEYFFEICSVDWEGMRGDYNKIVEDSINQSSTVILDPVSGEPTEYQLTGLLDKGQYSTYMWIEMYPATYVSGDQIPPGKSVGDYKYIDKYTDGFEFVEITDGGFTLIFPNGALAEKSVELNYFTEASTPLPNQTLKNMCEISGTDVSTEINASVTLAGGATVSGSKGQLIIFKQDSGEREKLSGVEFSLKKTSGNGNYDKTQSTAGNAGSTIFTLDMPFEGTYTLEENPNTTPNGYKCAEPITLKLNDSGEIIEINGVTINDDTIIPGVGHVDSDRLILIVYNEKAPEEHTVERTVIKLWEDNDNQSGLRPASVTVKLLADGEQYGPDVTLNENNKWEYTWTKLPEKDNGNAIVYSVKEIYPPDGYIAEYSADTFTITNKLRQNQEKVTVSVNGTKTLTGKILTDGMFSFEVIDESKNVVSVGINNADGEIIFSDITFSAPGTYIYAISEKNDGQEGIIYDTKTYTVRIVVEENPKDGKLKTTVNYPDGNVKFQNTAVTYLSKTAFTARKSLLGKDLEKDMFSFVVKDQSGNVVASAANQNDGTIHFPEIEFTNPGTYVYTIEETDNGLDGIVYDSTVYTVGVVATKGEDGLSLDVSYPENGIVFTNSYDSGGGSGDGGSGGGGSGGGGSGGGGRGEDPGIDYTKTGANTVTLADAEVPLGKLEDMPIPLMGVTDTTALWVTGLVTSACILGLLLVPWKKRKKV